MYPKMLILNIQYIPRNMHTVFFCCALLWLYIDWFSHIHQVYFTGTGAIVIASKTTLMNMDNTSCEFIMNDCITTTKQSTTKPCAYLLGYTVHTYTEVMSGTFQYTLSIMSLVRVIVFNCCLAPVDLPISLSVAILPSGHLYVDWIQQCLASHW